MLKDKRMNRCLVENQDCVMSWELDKNWGHSVLSPESCGTYMGHLVLAEPGSVPISTPGTQGELTWSKRGLVIKTWCYLLTWSRA